ncbi:MAG: YdcF family protein [Pseudoxanthomonas sp.]
MGFPAMLALLLSPLTLFLLWLAASLAFKRMLGKAGRAVVIGVAILLLALCTPLGANLLLRAVERQLPDADRCHAGDATDVLVLAGGFDRAPTRVGDYAALTQESWRRLYGAVAAWRDAPGKEFWIAGGGPFPAKESRTMAALAVDWGVPAAAVRVEERSANTWENAFELRGRRSERFRLVTSAQHMPRAMVAFRAAGFSPCAAPSHSDYIPPGGLGYYFPQASAIQKAADALYELAGMAQYRWRARRAG